MSCCVNWSQLLKLAVTESTNRVKALFSPLYMSSPQTVKFFQCAENIGFNSEKFRRRNSVANYICARILALNTTFTSRFPLQPYSTSPSPQLSLTLFLSMLHQAIQTKSKGARIVFKTALFVVESNFASLFLKLHG